MTNDNASAPTCKHSLLPPLFPNPILPHTKTMFDLSPQKPDRFPDFLTENYGAMNIGVVRAQGAVQNFGNFRTKDNRIAKLGDEEGESGVRTPPLWPGSPPRRPNNYRCLSPSSKAQAIAKGQKELMEMVRKMPESCYELSLKDLVEHPRMLEAKSENTAVIEGKKLKKMEQTKAQISRNGSIDNGGFLLKMVFPVSLGTKNSKKNKKNDMNPRVSPKPSGSESSSTKGEDKVWWKNKFSGTSESDCGESSLNSKSTKSSRSSSSNSTSSNGSIR